jgi:hypothetical protein
MVEKPEQEVGRKGMIVTEIKDPIALHGPCRIVEVHGNVTATLAVENSPCRHLEVRERILELEVPGLHSRRKRDCAGRMPGI